MRGSLVLAALVSWSSAAAAASPFDGFEDAAPRRGERAPAVALADARGAAVRVPSGRPTVLVFGSFS